MLILINNFGAGAGSGDPIYTVRWYKIMEFSGLSSGKILEILPCIHLFHKNTTQQKYSYYLPITPIASAFPYLESGK